MRLIEFSLSRTAQCPKLATRRKTKPGEGEGGLTVHPKQWDTRAANLAPGSKDRSESLAMEEEEGDHWGTPSERGGERRRGGEGSAIIFHVVRCLSTYCAFWDHPYDLDEIKQNFGT